MTDPAQERIAEMQYEAGMYQSLYENCQKEIARLQEAKRRALAIADERSKENVRLRAERDALVKALTVLLEEAENFSVSGVYFTEKCMEHKGPALAHAILDAVGTPTS
jgi:hypothetical protein